MPQVKYKRTRKLINKRLQLKMVGVFAAIGCVSALFQIVLINSSLLDIRAKISSLTRSTASSRSLIPRRGSRCR